MKNLKTLEGITELTKNEQKTIMGGNAPICEEGTTAKRCPKVGSAPPYWVCVPNVYQGGCD